MRVCVLCVMGMTTSSVLAQFAPDQPQERVDTNSRLAHQQLVAKAGQGTIDVYFVGDSITRRWGATDYPQLLAHWRENFFGWNVGNFGWGGDSTQHILWRLRNGELKGVRPKVFVVLAGTNNLSSAKSIDDVDAIACGVLEIVRTCRQAAPQATVVLMGVFPRQDIPDAASKVGRLNTRLEKGADGKQVRFVDLHDKFVDEQGQLRAGLFPDKLHPALPAYQLWAEALKPIFTEMLGPPAKTDSAPPPTGDPSAGPTRQH